MLSTLSGIGSELLYESCLVRDASSADRPALFTVPEERRIFFSSDGSAYNGPAHYHGEQNPGPNGYIGWMSGPSTGDMTNRIRLNPRRIPNRKVTSTRFSNRALNAAGFALTADSSYSGYVGTGEQEASDPGAVVFGDEIIRTLRSQMGQILTLGDNRYQDKLKELSILSLKRGQLNLASTNATAEDLSWVSTTGDKPYHGSIFVIRMGDIISSNSRFGYLYNLHANSTKRLSKDIRGAMISSSIIQNFSVSRRRLTNLPTGNNRVSTAKYEIYDSDEPEESIIQTISVFQNRRGVTQTLGNAMLSSRNNEKAKIWERSVPTHHAHRVIILQDYDLFNNIHTGKYEYVIDITLEDGIQNFLIEKHRGLKRAIKQFSTYVKEAAQPYQDYTQSGYYNGSQFADGLSNNRAQENAGTTGNYNHSIGDFTAAFKQRSNNLRERSDNVAELYAEIHYILTGQEQFDFESIEELKSSLLAKNTTLDSIEFFLDLCLKLESRFGSMLISSKTDIRDTLNLGSHRRNVSLGIKYPNKIIKLRGSAHVLAKAVDKNSLFVRPGVTVEYLGVHARDAGRSNRGRRRTQGRGRARQERNAQAPAAAAAGSFFGLSQIDLKDAGAFMDTGAPNRNSSPGFLVQVIADPIAAATPEEVSRLNSRIMAAIELSKAGPITQIKNQETVKDDMIMLDNVLEQYGGTKFESLLSKASFTSKSEIENKEAEKGRYTSKAFQASVFTSILASDRPEKFTEDIEEKYKDAFYKKKAMEELYEAVTTTLSVNDMMKQAKDAITFKERVLKSTSNKDKKTEKKKNFDKAARAIKENIFKAYMIDPDKGLVPAGPENKLGIVIYKKEGTALAGAKVTDNVVMVDPQAKEATTSSNPTSTKGKQ